MRVGLVTPKVTHPRNRKITDTENSIVEVRGARRYESRRNPHRNTSNNSKISTPMVHANLRRREARRSLLRFVYNAGRNKFVAGAVHNWGYSSLSRALLALRSLSPAALCRVQKIYSRNSVNA